jgi:hypothetical protein
MRLITIRAPRVSSISQLTLPNSMQKLTFTQKLLRQRNFLNSLLPLLAVLVGLGMPNKAIAQAFYNFDNVTISASTSAAAPSSITYDGIYDNAAPPPFNPFFEGADLGNGGVFNQAAGASTLLLSAGQANVGTINSTTNISTSSVYYRVYASGAPIATQPNFSLVPLGRTGAGTTGTSLDYVNSAANIDLLHEPAVLGGGTYVVEIKFVTTYVISGRTPQQGTVTDAGTTNTTGYQATFRVSPPLITPPNGTSTWLSTTGNGGSTDWTLASNWSNGVPTRFSDAIIPGKDTSPTGVAPVLNNPNTAYEVRTLTLQNSSNSSRATLTITTATLRVYGDLNQPGGGVTSNSILNSGVPDPTQNSTIVFAGGNQVIRGQLTANDVRIEGTGVKSVVNRMTIFNTIIMNPASTTNGVLLQTATESSSGGIIPVFTLSFDTSTSITIDLNGSGQLLGPLDQTDPAGVRRLPAETNVTFVQGVMRSNRVLRAGVMEKFGNIGLDITPNKPTTSDVIVTRIVGDALNGPTTSSATAVKRQFQVVGEVNSTAVTLPADVITSTIVFHYLDSSSGYNELNGNTNENNLVVFRTVNNGVPFIPQGGLPDPAANTVSRAGMTTINTVTLGDRTNPLPVTVASFDAKRIGNEALVSWRTASEQNSKGFNVQVSTNGTDYRTLGFIDSKSPNSIVAQNYSFTDTEKNKSGLRYYRLQQVDLDGKSAYFAPLTVSFDNNSNAVETKLAAYPNPFTSNVHLTLNAATEGQGMVRITDLTGRAISQRSITLTTGSNDVEMNNLSDLKAGIYMMHITLPNGTTQKMKVVKE